MTNIKEYILSISAVEKAFVFLDSCNQPAALDYNVYDWMAAWGEKSGYIGDSFDDLYTFQSIEKKWLFGYFSYDLKNKIEDLSSKNIDGVGAHDMCFFEPIHLVYIKDGLLYYNQQLIEEVHLLAVLKYIYGEIKLPIIQTSKVSIQPRISKDEYINAFNSIIKHIVDGDIYEINFCMEYFAENVSIDTLKIWKNLIDLSPTPYAAYIKLDDIYVMCASPERFITKQSQKMIAQPIKGTSKRAEDHNIDEQLKYNLKHNQKERSENVMIVDLMRNDLAKSSVVSSVAVEELFGIYTFKTVHQMISTVTSQSLPGIKFTDIIKNAFPMGSMTGCPKIRAMQLIEDFEQSQRGLFSGAIGYITPEADFDFNVVIRSLIYNSTKQYLSYQAGSAITYKSQVNDEYEECILKAETMKKALVEN